MKENSFKLEVVSKDYFKEYSNVSLLSVITSNGSMGIMKNHLDTYCYILKYLDIVSNNKRERIDFKEGFLIFKDNLARISIKKEKA